MRRLSGLQSTPLSPPLVVVRRRGSALPSLGNDPEVATCSPSVYDGSVDTEDDPAAIRADRRRPDALHQKDVFMRDRVALLRGERHGDGPR